MSYPPNERTPLTDEDYDAISLMVNREEYAERLTEWEDGFLSDIHSLTSLSIKQRDVFFNICERVLT